MNSKNERFIDLFEEDFKAEEAEGHDQAVEALVVSENTIVAYRPDQSRDEAGRFEEEGKGNGEPKPPGRTKVEVSKIKTRPVTKTTRVGKTAVNYHGHVSDSSQKTVEAAMNKVPEATRDHIVTIDVHEGAGPEATHDHEKFRVGGQTFTHVDGNSRIELYDRLGKLSNEAYTDDLIGHEAGHAAWARPVGETGMQQIEYKTFFDATSKEGCLTRYAQTHYDKNTTRGKSENFAEWYSMFVRNDESDMNRVRGDKPESFKTFNRIWTNMGGEAR